MNIFSSKQLITNLINTNPCDISQLYPFLASRMYHSYYVTSRVLLLLHSLSIFPQFFRTAFQKIVDNFVTKEPHSIVTILTTVSSSANAVVYLRCTNMWRKSFRGSNASCCVAETEAFINVPQTCM